ncbi:TetR/AcrR family transcriptional regulator [Thalassiella azotivora]
MPRAEREEQILRVAEEVFAERGVHAASMDEIAARVGVTKPVLYGYFGSKDGLLVACVVRCRQQLRAMTLAAGERASGPHEALRLRVRAFFDFVDEHARAWAVMRTEAVLATGSAAEAVEDIRHQQSRHLAEVLATAPGLTDLPATTLEAYADLLVGACERLALRAGPGGDLDAQTATDLVMDVVWSGLERLSRG